MRKSSVIKKPAPAVNKMPIMLARIGALYCITIDIFKCFAGSNSFRLVKILLGRKQRIELMRSE